MNRRLVVGLFVALLVVQPAAAANYPSMEEACGRTDGEVLVGVLPGSSDLSDEQVLRGQTSLYSGTTLKLALCKDGELTPTRGTEWSLSESPGLDVLGETDATVTVRITGAEPTVDVPALVSGKEGLNGVVVEVNRAPTVDSELVDEPIRFESPAAAEEYTAAEEEYLAAVSNLSAAADRLNESAGGVGGDADVNATLNAINASNEAVAGQRVDLERRLFEAAWTADGESSAVTALDAARDRERTARSDAKRAMDGYRTALEAAETDAKMTVALNFGVAALVGLVVGILPGWKLTASKLADIRYDRQVNSNVGYGPRVLARAVALALVALAVTAVALVALGGLETLGGLL